MGRRQSSESKIKNGKRDAMWEAVRKFNTMVPTLNSFARSLTGNSKVRVKAGKITQTDGRIVEIRPPLALAEKLDHQRELCDRRDSDRQLMCMACALNDDIWRKMYHELAHIVGDSLCRPNGQGLDAIMSLVDELHPVGTCDHGFQMKQAVLDGKAYVSATAAVTPYLNLIDQALEDARIDSRMIQVRPGLRSQFYASTWNLFTYGVEGDDDQNSYWRDAPVNAQAIIGLMLIGSGYEIEPGWLRDEVRLLLRDEQLRDIATGAGNWEDAHVTAVQSVKAFRRLTELGLFDDVPRCTTKDQEDPPSLRKPGDEGEKSDEQDESAGDQKSDDDAGESAGDDADASDGGDGSRDDASDPTGDGTAGDTASDGAFGNDFENPDDRADGDDQEGGDSDGQSDDASVPDDDRGDDQSGDAAPAGEAGPADDDEDDQDAPASGGDDSSDSDGAGDGDQSTEEPGEPGESDGTGGEGSDDSDDQSGVAGDEDSSVDDGDDPGEPVTQGEGDIGSDPGGSGDDDAPEVGSELEGAEDEDLEESADGADADGEADGASDDLTEALRDLDEEEQEYDEPLGESVWDEDNDPSQAVRSISPEEFGTADEVVETIEKSNPHEHTEEAEHVEAESGFTEEEILAIVNGALDEAIGQSAYFDHASTGVGGVREYTFPESLFRWERSPYARPKDFTPTEAIIGKALMKARAVFTENARTRHERNLKVGRINTRVLGRRAPLADDRLFQKKTMPGKREYVVGITLDCSGSTESSHRMERIKRAAFAKAEILSRLGIKFYITAHTGGKDTFWTKGYIEAMQDPDLEDLMILWVKKVDEPWNDKARERLAALMPLANNFDGHTLEFHRKLLQGMKATDKILMYYTDGAMPAANYNEELQILQSEIDICRKTGITLAAVGINTDSPKEYGFDTVQVDSDEDVTKVVGLLEKLLTR